MDLQSAELVASSKDKKSLPGMVLNIKKPIEYVDDFGNRHRHVFLSTIAFYLPLILLVVTVGSFYEAMLLKWYCGE